VDGRVFVSIRKCNLFAFGVGEIAIIPVFGLGIAAAITFQRTGFLLAPIITHVVYNMAVVIFNKP
jgi:membrane protease YdiL (CAAX protease family)